MRQKTKEIDKEKEKEDKKLRKESDNAIEILEQNESPFLSQMPKRTEEEEEYNEEVSNDYLFYPESKYKGWWEFLITINLLVTCFVTPVSIAFSETDEGLSMMILNAIIDIFFVIDIIVTFNSAFYTEDMELINNRKEITKLYLQGWFTIDLLAVIPFDYILNAT